MTSQNYSQYWAEAQAQVQTLVLSDSALAPCYSFMHMPFMDVLLTELPGTEVCYTSIFTALQQVETWMYGYCTAYSQRLAH